MASLDIGSDRIPFPGLSTGRAALLCALALVLVPGVGTAGDAKAGRKAATACQTCHGLDGLSKLPEAPNLAGQVEPYLVKALTEYRDGVRSNEIMNVVAKPLSDAEIANLAAYYSAIQIDVLPPG
ncbi:c-type cytochrome [Methylobacterium sp. J-068]|uniref:c-type cytochrome n=1 Tax=Methylobacterium sp. J-068 TaxID=2836649 RepID=UPI001FBAC297|nr:cytochrome c [Methylobacterium sp. J-068]MCJ2034354.1 cytochrome c [Methylobacterium sp. J-068]